MTFLGIFPIMTMCLGVIAANILYLPVVLLTDFTKLLCIKGGFWGKRMTAEILDCNKFWL